VIIECDVEAKYRFRLPPRPLMSHVSMEFIEVEFHEGGIKIVGGDSLEIRPEVSNVVTIKLVVR